MDFTNKSELLSYLKQKGLWAKKGLGQNFLISKEALDKIIEAAELKQDDIVVEVGPGVGTLTSELVKRAGEVVAVEMDKKLSELLGQNSKIKDQNCNLKIINADILKFNLNEIVGGRKYKVVANIPYYITSKIIEQFLTAENKPESIVLLVQKEVAERICAKPGEMSVLSVSVQLYGKPEIVGIVPKESFFPSPKVDSAILKIVLSSQLPVLSSEEERPFFRLVHIGFASRRKTLANNLSAGYLITKKTASDIIRQIGFSENVRAQELSIENWKKLISILK
ncbi:MAG: 16S rRNA (adenine(1518)-N(6)/adenine(1519)-N(6))-dimethyltransferase RsmA [Patescibacteria group bacterium]|nr:16S rRNA (adenine(1518)-N(6)/adenine(1519)-N(6))-dimethyltransferase RsmA [Patescibacteria group bacterium]